jgi:hypothetical protein
VVRVGPWLRVARRSDAGGQCLRAPRRKDAIEVLDALLTRRRGGDAGHRRPRALRHDGHRDVTVTDNDVGLFQGSLPFSSEPYNVAFEASARRFARPNAMPRASTGRRKTDWTRRPFGGGDGG